MNSNQWLTLEELARYLKISRSKIYQMSQDAEIPASKIGKQWRFNQKEIDTWMANKKSNHMARQQGEKLSHEEEG